MQAAMLYLLGSSACLSVLYTIYWLFLRKDTFFSMNRVFLVAMVVFSLLAPLLPYRWIPSGTSSPVMVLLDPVLITPGSIVKSLPGQAVWLEIAWIIYLSGVLILLLRFFWQLFRLYMITKRFGIRELDGHRVVSLDRGYSPFSFFNLVYMDKTVLPDASLRTILEHENVHIRQRHTIDLILLELAAVIQWFNPFIWWAGREMKTIHEYLADEGVLQNGISRSSYQQMILDETMGIRVNSLANNFNVSLLKKRIAMMTRSKSKAWAKYKVLVALPALAVLFLNLPIIPVRAMDPQDQARKATEKETFARVDKQPAYPGGQDAMIKFLIENIKYPKDAIRKAVTGTVFVNFMVQADGTISEVKVLRGIGSGCDEEAIRVVKLMPEWIPGENKGKPVAVWYTLPIRFALDEKKK